MDKITNQIDITKIVGSKSLLTRTQADKVLNYLIENGNKDLDMKKVDGCTSVFVNRLVYGYNKFKKFNRSGKLIFFNVSNPIVVLKIQEAQFDYFTKKESKRVIKLHDKLLDEALKNC